MDDQYACSYIALQSSDNGRAGQVLQTGRIRASVILRTSCMSSHTVVAAAARLVLHCLDQHCDCVAANAQTHMAATNIFVLTDTKYMTAIMMSEPLISTHSVRATNEHSIFHFPQTLLGLFAKNSRRLSSSHLTSSLLSPGPVRNVNK